MLTHRSLVTGWRFPGDRTVPGTLMIALSLGNKIAPARGVLDLRGSRSSWWKVRWASVNVAHPTHGDVPKPFSTQLTSGFISTRLSQVSLASSVLIGQQAQPMPITLDHSSFANYRQAAVTHIDLGDRSFARARSPQVAPAKS